MDAAIEARSLSTLTTLAFDPPDDIRGAIRELHDPIVLYIARVPGSRDVFLTPLKPRDKLVSAADVESSLYYVHADSPEDSELLDPPEGPHYEDVDGITECATPSSTSAGTVKRRPLPPIPTAAETPSALHTPEGYEQPKEATAARLTTRKPVPPPRLAVRRSAENRPSIDALPSSRGLAGPRVPGHQRGHSDNIRYQADENMRPELPPRLQSAHASTAVSDVSSAKPTSFRDPFSTHRPVIGANSASVRPEHLQSLLSPSTAYTRRSSSDLRPSNTATTLTLIRRDPSAGAQWNVAKLRDPPVEEVSSIAFGSNASTSHRKPAGAPMFIDILNPTYGKFQDETVRVDRPPTSISDRSGESGRSSAIYSQGSTSAESASSDISLQRRLWMEGSKYQDRAFGHRKLNSTNSIHSVNTSNGQIPTGPHHFDGMIPDGHARLTIAERRSSTFRGYIFMSPWNGRCEFSTGGGGNSLKCRHILPSNEYDPIEGAAQVSELRFNLPNSSLFNKPSTPTEVGSTSKRSSFFGQPHDRRRASSDLTSDFSQLDLSLGQEDAGGGFGGKQAKLGKLIIEAEGLKMMDLLVAANMALWWRAYERAEVA